MRRRRGECGPPWRSPGQPISFAPAASGPFRATGGDEERRTLPFRDHLREQAWARREYEGLEFRCARQFGEATPADREAYAQAKGKSINRIIGLAFSAGYPRDL